MWEMHTMHDSDNGRRSEPPPPLDGPSTSEDLHAWSIYRQNLNSDFTDSALGSAEKSPLPYGNFHLREQTMASILTNPKYGPKSELGGNAYTYLKFGLPRVLPPRPGGGSSVGGGGSSGNDRPRRKGRNFDNSSGYDSTDEEGENFQNFPPQGSNRARSVPPGGQTGLRSYRSEEHILRQAGSRGANPPSNFQARNRYVASNFSPNRSAALQEDFPTRRLRAVSEADLLNHYPNDEPDAGNYLQRPRPRSRSRVSRSSRRSVSQEDILRTSRKNLVHSESSDQENPVNEQNFQEARNIGRLGHGGPKLRHKTASQLSVARRQEGLIYRQEAPVLNDKYFPKDDYEIGYGKNRKNFGGHDNVHFSNDFEMNRGQEGDGFGAVMNDGIFKYPHLQLRNVSYEVKKGSSWDRVLDGINIEARGGEILAIMATTHAEGTSLCDVIANHTNINWNYNSRTRGDLIINGVQMQASAKRMRDRVSYVQINNDFTPDMSVRQTMLFHAFLREPGTQARARDTKGRINALIEDLGLAQVRHTRVKDLTVSEKQRLNVACHLLLDADIVVLDQPTRGMDIFDTFFLVEYLRQWAGRGRIVILTLQPPTYEILTMISKVVLISTGRLMYFGKRREMLPYFAFIDYPCPAYKNPSDYYLDLVTLDNLSTEAMLESSQRIDQLAAAFRRRAEPLSDPGPPGIMPPKLKKANLLVQVIGIFIRALIYTYPFNVISWVKQVLLAGTMSVCLGAIFLGIRWRYWDRSWTLDPIFEQDNVVDRFGFHHVMMAVGVWPVLMSSISSSWKSKSAITRDVNDGLYSKFSFLLTKSLYGLVSSGGVFLAYIVPGYLLAGLHYPQQDEDLNNFYYYIGYMLLYLQAVQTAAFTCTHLLSSRHLATGLTGLLLTCLTLVSGFMVHHEEVGPWASWLKYVSPQWWLQHPLLQDELNPVQSFRCSKNPVTTEKSIIILKIQCGLVDGKAALRYFNFLPFQLQSIFRPFSPDSTTDPSQNTSNLLQGEDSVYSSLIFGLPFIATLVFYVIFSFLSFVGFLCVRQTSKRSRSKLSKM